MKRFFTSIAIFATMLCASAQNQLFFKHMFENKTSDESIVGHGYRDDWGFYKSDDGRFILIDMAILSAVEPSTGIICCNMTFNGEGCKSEEEAKTILESKVKPAIESLANDKKNKSAYVAASMDSSKLEIYAYTYNTEELKKEIEKSKLVGRIGKNMNISFKNDQNWEIYQSKLFPDQWNYQKIQNQRIIEDLQAKGDVNTKLHIVSHMISFSSDMESAEKFAAKAKTWKYYVDEVAEEDGIVKAVISKKSKTDIESITIVTNEVMNLAKEFGGEYVEWSTRVMRD
ncbi:MAG: ribonuclease E inhibitor RraB [Paludibacteraceae bacterium]|nr:ribonuclease E inhibitor RraB [Paludibacteraceae bacterium]